MVALRTDPGAGRPVLTELTIGRAQVLVRSDHTCDVSLVHATVIAHERYAVANVDV